MATIYVAFKENNELKPKTTNLEMQSTKDESNVVAGSKIKETVSKKSSKTFLYIITNYDYNIITIFQKYWKIY